MTGVLCAALLAGCGNTRNETPSTQKKETEMIREENRETPGQKNSLNDREAEDSKNGGVIDEDNQSPETTKAGKAVEDAADGLMNAGEDLAEGVKNAGDSLTGNNG